jgi:endonuclease/exonuclease/phosphatase family metal-dependent hydrolase
VFKKLFFILVFLLCGLYILFWWAGGGVQKPGEFDDKIETFKKTPNQEEALETYELSILTWNIGFAYGFGSDGEGYEPKSAEKMEERLKKIGDVIRNSKADIVFLQEIDFNSKRSYNVDQLEKLSEITGLRHGAYATGWKARYVPFPYWPIGSHFGQIESGGAVLSRHPIKSNTVKLYPKPKSNAWWYNAFYPFRYSQQVVINLGYKELFAINTHLEAYDTKTRVEQATALTKTINSYKSPKSLVLLAGDMNALPTNATKTHDFPDNPKDDYRNDNTMNLLNSVTSLKEAIGEEVNKEYESEIFTFPSHEPSRRLDYIFASSNGTVKSARVLKAGDLSDHLPVYAKLQVNINK